MFDQKLKQKNVYEDSIAHQETKTNFILVFVLCSLLRQLLRAVRKWLNLWGRRGYCFSARSLHETNSISKKNIIFYEIHGFSILFDYYLKAIKKYEVDGLERNKLTICTYGLAKYI